jgi:hypothetical protein
MFRLVLMGRACGPAHRRTSSVKNCFFRLPASGNTCPGFDQKEKGKTLLWFPKRKGNFVREKKAVQRKNGRLNGRLPDRIILLFLGLLNKCIKWSICWHHRWPDGNMASSGEKSDQLWQRCNKRIKWSGP